MKCCISATPGCTLSSLFSKCFHSENKSSSAAINYITKPIGLQPIYVLNEERERKWSQQKWHGMNAQLCGKKNLHTHTQTHAGAHTQTVSAPEEAGRSAALSCSPRQTRDRPSCLCVLASSHENSFHWPHQTQPLTRLTFWRKAQYLRTTSGLKASLCQLIRHRTCCRNCQWRF